jgi:peptidyl-prolyl cis-trans isomerase B (cyclophilin B)
MANPILTIEMENGNKIKVELFSDLVPTAVEYFLSYVKTGYYDACRFIRA